MGSGVAARVDGMRNKKKKQGRTGVYRPGELNETAKRMLKDRSVSVIVDNFHGVNWWEQTKVFPCFTVYEKPTDFPDKFAVRLFDGDKPTRLLCIKNTLSQARAAIPKGFLRVTRSEKDDPKIVETWL